MCTAGGSMSFFVLSTRNKNNLWSRLSSRREERNTSFTSATTKINLYFFLLLVGKHICKDKQRIIIIIILF